MSQQHIASAPLSPPAAHPYEVDPVLSDGEAHSLWEQRARIVLTPYSPPSIIGLLGFMGATLMVGAWQAGWYGDARTGLVLFPFAAVFGGLFQGAAAFPALRARDGLAAGIHATWGAFWIGFGILFGLQAAGVLPASSFGSVNTGLAFWFIVLTLVTSSGALVAALVNWAVFGVLTFLAVGSGFTAAGWWAGNDALLQVGGWLFVISAVIAWYTATAMTAENMTGRALLPVGPHKLRAEAPALHAIEYSAGMPGVKIGQ